MSDPESRAHDRPLETSENSGAECQNFAPPLDWRHVTIGELEGTGEVALFRGKVISRKDINQTPGDYPVYSSSVHSDGLFGHYGHYMFDEELITWSVDGGGHFFYRPKHRFSVTNVCGYLRIHTKNIDYRFLAFQLQQLHSRLVFDYTLKAHPSVIRGAYTVLLPSTEEQREIAEALGDVDALLVGLDRLIAKKRDLKRAAMQQLLTGATRLPGFRSKWGAKQIAEFASCTAGGTPSTLVREYWGGSIRWMSSGELQRKTVRDVDGRITEHGLVNSSAKMLPTRCVLVGLAGQGKTRGTVAINLVPLSTNQSIAAIIPNSTFVPEYLYHNLDSRYDELRDLSSGGSGRGGLNLTIIRSIVIPFPSVSEQRDIATVLSDMDTEITALEVRRNKTQDLKWAMMQELLTGRTRLVESECAHA